MPPSHILNMVGAVLSVFSRNLIRRILIERDISMGIHYGAHSANRFRFNMHTYCITKHSILLLNLKITFLFTYGIN